MSLGQALTGAVAEPYLDAEDLEQRRLVAHPRLVGRAVVDDHDPRTEVLERVGGGEAGDAEAGHRHPRLLPAGVAARAGQPVGPDRAHRWTPRSCAEDPLRVEDAEARSRRRCRR